VAVASGAGCGRAVWPRFGAARRLDHTAVFALALSARLCVVFTSGGLQGNYGYDASVYYAAADGLVHGRLPYRDFVLLHPPGIMLALAPFAWIGRLTTDHTGFIAANLGFSLLGALNAVLVVRVAGQLSLGRRAALLGGCCYALWFGSVQAEYLARLEPLGDFLLLSALSAYLASARSRHRYAALACGAMLGAATSVKIWWAVPLLVVLGWHLVDRRPRRDLLLAAAGAVASLIVVNVAFFIAAPAAMWRMVVAEQLGRQPDSNSTLTRLASLTDVNRVGPHLHRAILIAVLAVVAIGYLAACALAWTVVSARIVVALATAQLGVLLAAPSWFAFYADYLAPALALTIAAAAGSLGARASVATRRGTHRRLAISVWLPLAAVGAVTAGVFIGGHNHAVQPFPGPVLAHDVSRVRCVESDSPMALIELDALSRDFSHGCHVWVDVTGLTYAPQLAARNAEGARLPRRANGRWQSDLRAYLTSGNAIVIVRAAGTGLSPATTAAIERGGVLAADDGVVVYRSPNRSRHRPHASSTAHAKSRHRHFVHHRDADHDDD
jgi:alpha-1,2-mannosyltransferase